MKNLMLFSLFLLTLGFFSCSKDAKALKKIDGDWKVQNIQFLATDGTSLDVTPTNAILSILSCDKKDNQTPNACSMTYTQEGNVSVNFSYQISADKDNTNISIRDAGNNNATSDQYINYFKGSNALSFSDKDTKMTMDCIGCQMTIDGTTFTSRIVSLSKK